MSTKYPRNAARSARTPALAEVCTDALVAVAYSVVTSLVAAEVVLACSVILPTCSR
jgi:hypothetical protein